MQWDHPDLDHGMNLLTQKRLETIARGVAAAFDMDLELELKQGAIAGRK